jgi:hypothetical protein
MTPLIDHGNRYGFGVVRALNGSTCNGIIFIDVVSNVCRNARLQLTTQEGGVLVDSWFIVDPRMTFSSVKIPHECRGEFGHNAVVSPAFVAETEGECNETG